MRVKTVWFKKESEARAPDQTATVIASVIWRLADKTVTNLSKADYDIITPQRGFKIIAEMIAFLVHMTDRLIYERADETRRGALIQALGVRLAEIMEQNIHSIVGDDGFDYQSNFLDMLNRRMEDYATFDFPADQPDFSARRYLGSCILDMMEKRDQPWVIDQMMELEAPEALETLRKTVNGLFNQPQV